MIQAIPFREGLRKSFYYFSRCYDSVRFPDLEAVYQFILSDSEETYNFYIHISQGKSVSFEGMHHAPTLKIYSSLSDWCKIINGRLNPYWSVLSGKCRVDGNPRNIWQLKRIFGKKFDKQGLPETGQKAASSEISKRINWKKPNKVLVINASARCKEGFTYFYLNRLLEGIRKTGCDIEEFDLYDSDIHIESCKGCFGCWYAPGQCVIKDDTVKLVDAVDNAYLTIYAFPVYTGSLPDKLITLFNKQMRLVYPYWGSLRGVNRHPRRIVKERYMAIFSTFGSSGKEHFKASLETFNFYATQLHTPLISCILRPGGEELFKSFSCRDNLKEVLSVLERSGKELVDRGRVPSRLLRIISKTYIPMSRWRRNVNTYWYLKLKEYECLK